MAKGSSPIPKDVELTAPQMRAAITRFQRRIADLENFEPTSVRDRRDPRIDALEVSIDEAVSETFGRDTPAYRLYSRAKDLDTAGINMNGTPHHEVIDGLLHGKDRAIVLLKQAIRSLEEKLEDATDKMTEAPPERADTVRGLVSDEIFIVHGHDEAAKTEVAHFIERAGLRATILHQQPNAGRTIIEKFEKHGSAAGFAVVIVTPDDVGGHDTENLKPRARQNVIGEMFWFAGRLGRDRVCALVKEEVEMPSDFAGVGYTPMDNHGGWKSKLLQELDAAGYKQLDWKKALA
jgi:predicted nucleotide-binding protein